MNLLIVLHVAVAAAICLYLWRMPYRLNAAADAKRAEQEAKYAETADNCYQCGEPLTGPAGHCDPCYPPPPLPVWPPPGR